MKKLFTLLLVLCANASFIYAQDLIKIYGRVTDFNNNPLDSVSVRLKNRAFENLYETLSDKNGYFSLTVSKGHYYCLYAIKPSDYGKTKLEYWAWNIPAYRDLEINPQYERMEIYGVNVMEPQVSPWETYYVYFRPMSLTKGLNLKQGNNNNPNIIDIAPSLIQSDELMIKINDMEAEVLNITKIKEYARGGYMFGYIAQIKKPNEVLTSSGDYDKISIILHSKETNEYGKSDYFYEKK